MKKTILFATAVLLFCPQVAFSQQTVNLSTYYPAPFGTYDRIRLVPRPPVVAGACQVGTMYTRDTDFTLQYCRITPALDPDAGAWGPIPETWSRSGGGTGNEIFLTDGEAAPAMRVGIKDETPDATLEVSDSGQGDPLLMLSSDDANDGDILIVNNAGNVGIGTNTPNVDLAIVGVGPDIVLGADDLQGTYAAGTSVLEMNGTDNILGLRSGGGLQLYLNATAGFPVGLSGWGPNGVQISSGSTASPQQLLFGTTTGELYLNPSEVTIGQNTPAPAPAALNINGQINLNNGTANWGILQLQYYSGAGGPDGWYAVYAP